MHDGHSLAGVVILYDHACDYSFVHNIRLGLHVALCSCLVGTFRSYLDYLKHRGLYLHEATIVHS